MKSSLKTEGIVLSCVKYGEGSVIVNVLTLDMGRLSFIVKSTGKSRKQMMPMLVPLSIVVIEATLSAHSTLHHVKEVHVAEPLSQMPFDPIKRSIAFFMGELVNRAVGRESADGDIYVFVRNSLLALDEGMEGLSNFHLYFMWRLMGLLGFEPDVTGAEMVSVGGKFDMVNGVYVRQQPLHSHVLSGEEAILWAKVGKMAMEGELTVSLSREERQRAISLMTEFYALHIPTFAPLKSAEILRQVLG